MRNLSCVLMWRIIINLGDFFSNLALFGPLMTPYLDMKGSSFTCCFISIFYEPNIFMTISKVTFESNLLDWYIDWVICGNFDHFVSFRALLFNKKKGSLPFWCQSFIQSCFYGKRTSNYSCHAFNMVVTVWLQYKFLFLLPCMGYGLFPWLPS